MKRTWPIIGVANVAKSSAWHIKLLDGQDNHPSATVFDQIVDKDDTVLVCVHHWGDHHHPSLSQAKATPALPTPDDNQPTGETVEKAKKKATCRTRGLPSREMYDDWYRYGDSNPGPVAEKRRK